MFVQSCLNNSLVTGKCDSTIKTRSYNIANLKLFVFETPDKSSIYTLSVCFFKGPTSKEAMFNRSAIFLPMTGNLQFFYSHYIGILVSHDTKQWCFLKPLQNRHFNPCSKYFDEVNYCPLRYVLCALRGIFEKNLATLCYHKIQLDQLIQWN